MFFASVRMVCKPSTSFLAPRRLRRGYCSNTAIRRRSYSSSDNTGSAARTPLLPLHGPDVAELWQKLLHLPKHFGMAAAFLKANGITNLPDIDKLKKVKAEVLTPAFNSSLEAYKEKCADLTEIKIMHHNIHALLDGNWGQERAVVQPEQSKSRHVTTRGDNGR